MPNLYREYTMIGLYCSTILTGFCGFALFGFGLVYIIQNGIFLDYFHYPYGKYPIIAGVVFAVVAAISFFTTIISRNFCIGFSIILLFALLSGQITLSSMGLNNLLNDELDGDLRKFVLDIYDHQNRDFEEIESNLKCCGFNGPMDYNDYVPNSCCEDNSKIGCSQSQAFQKGCLDAYYEKIVENVKISSGLSIFAAILEILSIIMSMLYMGLNRSRR